MPQLDLVTYNFINISLFLSFWIYFAVLYIAVSYTMQKISAGIYFKFFMLLSTLLVVYAIMDIRASKDEGDVSFNFEKTEKIILKK